MKIVILFFLLVIFNFSAFGQTKIVCNQKQFCKILSEDEEECSVTNENSFFKINRKETQITQTGESLKTIFIIDSKIYDEKLSAVIYEVHTSMGEKLKFMIKPKKVKIQSLNYPEINLVYNIKKNGNNIK